MLTSLAFLPATVAQEDCRAAEHRHVLPLPYICERAPSLHSRHIACSLHCA